MTRITEESQVRVADPEAERAIIAEIDACKKTGDTLGGVVEVIATGLPVGLGSHVQWDRKLDGRLAHALLSLQAVKGVEIGMGFRAAAMRGSALHDEIGYDPAARRFTRHSNNSGGTEGGMTTGEPLRVRVAFKPLSTLMRPLRSADIKTKAEAVGQHRALRRMRDSGRGGDRRGGGRVRTGQRVPGKVRRRFAGRDHAQLPRLPRAGAQFLTPQVPNSTMAPKLILTGFMATGKSAVGRAVAARLGWRLIDSDAHWSRARENRSRRSFASTARRISARSSAR